MTEAPNQPPQEAPAEDTELKNYQKSNNEKREISIAKSLIVINQEREQMDTSSRFGYFSIPYPATVGDKAYNREKEYQNHKVEDRKVIIEKRGIYTTIPKTGKNNDAYFEPIEPVSAEEIEKRKKQNSLDLQLKLDKIKQQKENKASIIPFRPPGVQALNGFYDSSGNSPERKGPLYFEKNKFSHIGPDHKVIIERRGIYANPPKVGVLPSEYFAYPFTDDELLNKYKQMNKEEKEQYEKEIAERKNKKGDKPFSPASFKNEPFISDRETYCNADDETRNKRMEEFREWKKNGRKKFKIILPSGSVQHITPFRPAKLVSTGRDTLFDDHLYSLPPVKEENKLRNSVSVRELREMEKKKARVPFTFNKMMKSSVFSPSISSFHTNLKSEFPRLFSMNF